VDKSSERGKTAHPTLVSLQCQMEIEGSVFIHIQCKIKQVGYYHMPCFLDYKMTLDIDDPSSQGQIYYCAQEYHSEREMEAFSCLKTTNK
jgi:hypothetical protein